MRVCVRGRWEEVFNVVMERARGCDGGDGDEGKGAYWLSCRRKDDERLNKVTK